MAGDGYILLAGVLLLLGLAATALAGRLHLSILVARGDRRPRRAVGDHPLPGA